MYKYVFLCIITSISAFAQEHDMSMKRKAYRGMVNKLLNHTVDELEVTDSFPTNIIFLDARAKVEYEVSHIRNARLVGYDNFKISALKDLDKDKPIVVYCSVGYRSEKVAEQLTKEGFTQVYNLLGGIFEWYNCGKVVIDSDGQPTGKIHGYNALWGQWLDPAEVVY